MNKFCYPIVIVALLGGLLWTTTAKAQPLDLSSVLDSARQHTPLLLERIAAQKVALAEERGAYGAFDLNLVNKSRSRVNGFWDGSITDTQIQRRLPGLNTRLYAGYRISSGDFPIYEDVLFTNSQGELKAGVALSLLQNRDFDQTRYNLISTRLSRDRATYELQLSRVQVQYQAMTQYQQWLASGLVLDAYQNLRNLANDRQVAFERRVFKGDLARIFLNENRQNILKRETLVNEAQRAFNYHSQKLSFYYRNRQGEPIKPELEQLPGAFPELQTPVLLNLEGDLLRAEQQRPETLIVDNEIELARADLRQGQNLMQPQLDFNVEVSRDFGTGSVTREGTDVILGLTFTLPLERTRARSAIARARAKIDELHYRQQIVNEQLEIEILNLANDVEAAKRLVEITEQEVEQAQIMQAAESKRFENGASDFFLLNIREENTADAIIRNILSQEQYLISLAAYYAATVNTSELELELDT